MGPRAPYQHCTGEQQQALDEAPGRASLHAACGKLLCKKSQTRPARQWHKAEKKQKKGVAAKLKQGSKPPGEKDLGTASSSARIKRPSQSDSRCQECSSRCSSHPSRGRSNHRNLPLDGGERLCHGAHVPARVPLVATLRTRQKAALVHGLPLSCSMLPRCLLRPPYSLTTNQSR